MSEEKSCRTCRWSNANNPTGLPCFENPKSPTYMDNDDIDMCIGYKDWTPVEPEWEPSEMDLLALESKEKKMPIYGRSQYDGNIYYGYVVNIGKHYTIKGKWEYTAKEIYREKPQTWKDLTPKEVKENLFEDVWMWDTRGPEKFLYLDQRKLCGYRETMDIMKYISEGAKYMHASLTKPEE